MRQVKVIHTPTGNSNHVYLKQLPDECGICHKNIAPQFIAAVNIGGPNSQFIEATFQCTNDKCRSLIIGYYIKAIDGTGNFELQKNAPIIPKGQDFHSDIIEVSPNFVEIYNQSLFAEQTGLTLISGIGFRKALEFLIKDFLVYLTPEEEETILRLPLGQCINKLENPNLKEMAKRATWIGNDEAHYNRKWEGKDVSDLKRLIEVTVHYISMEITTKKYIIEMS
ncbi:DUF4145 domain-containing protein [Vibrio vulnificus]|nr:DUF4145 domain-containing protein [Vibrio vulnificus]